MANYRGRPFCNRNANRPNNNQNRGRGDHVQGGVGGIRNATNPTRLMISHRTYARTVHEVVTKVSSELNLGDSFKWRAIALFIMLFAKDSNRERISINDAYEDIRRQIRARRAQIENMYAEAGRLSEQ
ncbi:hypothetical protein Q1695_001235 [Nippostrongylus brasiliensis]|nr:hypothetical protein Q1695_001235 [Nippostrongylus brasiliensis]